MEPQGLTTAPDEALALKWLRHPAATRRLRETAIFVLVLAALVLFVALATYNPRDPGFVYAGSGAPVHNGAGPVGARVSDFLYYYLGRPAVLFPLMLFLPAWLLHRQLKGDDRPRRATRRLVGFAIVVLASCALASMQWVDWPRPQQSAGGVLGAALGRDWLQSFIGPIGATVVLVAVWIAGLSLSCGMSPFAAMEWIGQWVMSGFGLFAPPPPIDVSDVQAGPPPRLPAPLDIGRAPLRPGGRAPASAVPVTPEPPPGREAPRPASAAAAGPARAAERSAEGPAEGPQIPLFEPPSSADLPLDLLDDPPPQEALYAPEKLKQIGDDVVDKLKEFNIKAEVVNVEPGPVVTRLELRPGHGVKASQITSLNKDLARALKVLSVRVVEVIPGKDVMGLEVANDKRQLIYLKEILRSGDFRGMRTPMALGLGKDISGMPFMADLARMPHLLIAGTTGSGKSVTINAMILSLLYKAKPEHVRLIMIDPKMLELSVYKDIPHLLTPVVTDMRLAANALRWCVQEMDERFQLMAALGVRNLAGYNAKVKEAIDAGRPMLNPVLLARAANDPSVDQSTIPTLTPMPYIVVVIDELADLMMIAGKKMDELIARLAQKARAAGIHLVLATQRPSVDVITGLIKANIPCRIAFQVSSKVDSRTILDQMGAETLLGNGDMLYLPAGTSAPVRVHGAFVSDQEVHRVVDVLRQMPQPDYNPDVLNGPANPLVGEDDEPAAAAPADGDELDERYDEAVRIVTTERKPSISYVQRRLKIGYNRAARILEAMEREGVVGPLQPNGQREVLVSAPPEDG
jgi:S-DNA-T family DNA segregation ATPase FtsK/SpoIIIE